MKAKHIEHKAMFTRVIDVMDKHLSVWKNISELSKTHDQFVKNYKAITTLQEAFEKPLQPLEEACNNHRDELQSKLIPMISVLRVYAMDKNSNKLKELLVKEGKRLQKMNEKQLVRFSNYIVDIATDKKKSKKQPSLSEYGITDEMISELETLTKNFQESSKALKKARKDRKKQEAVFIQLVQANRKLLKGRLDQFVKFFRDKHPAFYEDYFNARKNPEKASKKKQSAKAVSKGNAGGDMNAKNAKNSKVGGASKKKGSTVSKSRNADNSGSNSSTNS